jgi:hypothetical protein
MASSSGFPLNISTQPEELDWSIASYYPQDGFAPRHPSVTAESSMFDTDAVLYNPILHPSGSQDSHSEMLAIPAHLDVHGLSPNTFHYTGAEDTSTVTSLVVELDNPRRNPTCITSQACNRTDHDISQSKVSRSRSTKGKMPSDHGRVGGPTQE